MSLTILYVEDNRSVADVARDILSQEGWKVDVCEDGLTALARIESATVYDLIILDHELPHLTGVDLVKCARELPHRRQTPIIVASGRNVQGIARAAGATWFLSKPEDMRNLVGVIRRLTNQ